MKDVYDMNNLYNAFTLTSKESKWKESVQRFEMNLFINIRTLSYELKNGTYKQRPSYSFTVNDRGKTRNIRSIHIRDRVVQRSLCDNVITPLFKPYLAFDNGASIKGKGVDFTRRRLEHHLRKYYRKHGNNGYILQIDFSKYFDNIDHKILLNMMRDLIEDNELYYFIKSIIDSFGDEKSVAIGAQISQNIGVYYPIRIDNYCKIVRQCKYYGRYNDDIYIIHHDINFLKELLEEIKTICSELKIVINPKKTHIAKLSRPFTFLKISYTLKTNGKIIKKLSIANITRMRRKLKKLKIKVDNGELDFDYVYQVYHSWRENYKKYNNYESIKNLDRLFDSLFCYVPVYK